MYFFLSFCICITYIENKSDGYRFRFISLVILYLNIYIYRVYKSAVGDNATGSVCVCCIWNIYISIPYKSKKRLSHI